MIEGLLGLLIVALSIAGLGLGLLFGRGPVKTSCGAAACVKEVQCAFCPRRALSSNEDER